jgi:hypothetical protein
MKLEVRLPKGVGVAVGNALRQIAMSRLSAWVPIAISLDRKFNTVHTTAEIPEDMPSIMAGVTSLRYVPTEGLEGNFIKEKFTFTKSLRSSEMMSDNFVVSGPDSVIMTSLEDRAVTLTIVFRKASGEMDHASNADFLIESGERREDYMVFNSRHTNVRNFTFDIKEASLLDEWLILCVDSDTADEMSLLEDSLSLLLKNVSMVQSRISQKDPEFYREEEEVNQGFELSLEE